MQNSGIWIVTAAMGIASIQSFAQQTIVRSEGNEAIRQQLQPVIRSIYDSAHAPRFLLRKLGLPGVQSTGAEVTGYNVDADLSRIVGSACAPRGKYSVEYYFRSGALIHVYETFEFYDEAAPKRAWRNFKGIPAWERRIYFEKGAIGFVESVGVGLTRPASAQSIRSGAHELLIALQARPPVR